MTLGWALWSAGMAQFVVAWLFFRHPGCPFWRVAPITRASEFLTPAGVALWVGGLVLALVGVVDIVARMLAAG